MHKVLKPQNVVSLSESVVIPDYIPPTPSVVDIVNIDDMDIDDENIKEKYNMILQKARADSEIIASGIIKNAEDEKQKILDDAKAEYDRIISEAQAKSRGIMQNTLKEAEQIRTDAFNEGTEKAIKDKYGEVDRILSELKDVIEDMKSSQLDYFERYANELKYLAIEITEKVTMQKISEDELFLLNLISKNVKSIREAGWITIEMSDKLPALADAVDKAMVSGGLSKKTEIQQVNDMDTSSCILKATDRIVDISLRTQLENIKAYFEKCDKTDD